MKSKWDSPSHRRSLFKPFVGVTWGLSLSQLFVRGDETLDVFLIYHRDNILRQISIHVTLTYGEQASSTL